MLVLILILQSDWTSLPAFDIIWPFYRNKLFITTFFVIHFDQILNKLHIKIYNVMHWNGFQRSKSLFMRHSKVKNQFSMNHLSINYFFTNTIIPFSVNFSSDDQFLFFQFVARELQKLISRTESPLSLLPWQCYGFTIRVALDIRSSS